MAVNIEAMIPSDSVTAKPRTGPEPSPKSSAAAMIVVMFESAMVANAFS